MITFERSDGMNSRTRKLTPLQVIVIRAEYDAGKRGQANAWRQGVSAVQYNCIGRREAWKELIATKGIRE